MYQKVLLISTIRTTSSVTELYTKNSIWILNLWFFSKNQTEAFHDSLSALIAHYDELCDFLSLLGRIIRFYSGTYRLTLCWALIKFARPLCSVWSARYASNYSFRYSFHLRRYSRLIQCRRLLMTGERIPRRVWLTVNSRYTINSGFVPISGGGYRSVYSRDRVT